MNHKHLISAAAFILSGLAAQAQTIVLFTQLDSKKDVSQIILIDEKGKQTLVSTPARKVNSFSEGLAPLQTMDKKFGFIDESGTLVIPSQFVAVGYFSDGLAWARNEKGKVGFIDRSGKWVLQPEFDAAKSFEPVSGMARVKKDGRWSYVDRSGKILPLDAEASFDFSEGLAICIKDGLRGYINNEGKWVIAPQFIDAKKFENGHARVKMPNDKWGLIDKSGKWVVEAIYEVMKEVETLE